MCCVCAHPRRDLVELALVHRMPVRVIAKRFELSKDSLFRHRRLHMPPQLIAAIAAAAHPSEIDLEQLQRSESEGLLGALVGQRARLQMLSEMAFEQGELCAATCVERAITNSLELTSKLLGMIVGRTSTTNILISSDYLRAQGRHRGRPEALPRGREGRRHRPGRARARGRRGHRLEREAALVGGEPVLMASDMSRCLDPVRLARACGIEPDDWQAALLRERPRRGLWCCSRQSGKTTTALLTTLWTVLYEAPALCLIVSPSLRQSAEAFRTFMMLYHRLDGCSGVKGRELDAGRAGQRIEGDQSSRCRAHGERLRRCQSHRDRRGRPR